MSLTLINTNNNKRQNSMVKTDSKTSQWHAFLDLTLASTLRGVVLKSCAHQGPLYVQKPFYPEGKDLAHLYILHPPGGLVSGDTLNFSCHQEANAHLLLTTPGAGRVYRARQDKSLQSQNNLFHVGESASLEWLPQETILYPDANTKLMTQVDLAKNAHFIGWEVTCFGLPASDQTFTSGQVSQTFEIRQQGQIKFREKNLINKNSFHLLSQQAGFNQQSVNALMVAGPCINEPNKPQETNTLDRVINALQQDCEHLNQAQTHAMASVSLTGEFLLIRYLGDSSEQAKQLFLSCWQKIRPFLLNRDACIPRIWAT
ncbi:MULTISPECIES: urease accessory protein UreD [unclassified Marinomonas]|uniref:urease accessory protein UreD n=1 Tax=unclassified Marinomonas TaxID=196814 RepID=UPI0007AF6F52|nr:MULTISPECIES: urease accessory protein UreD [unclassified Marinomonas]